MSSSPKSSIYNPKINKVISCWFQKFVPPQMMEEEDTGGDIRFIDNHVPAIKEGDYTLTATQTISENDGLKPVINQQFHIGGPQFGINPQDILSVFPPAGSIGDHAYVLPHIAFKRISLPWEVDRDLLKWDNNPSQTNDPWLALLLFSDTEIPEIKTETLKELDLSNKFNLDDEQVNTIEVDATYLDMLPKVADLTFLAHVRQKVESADPDNVLGEQAYIVANRLPATNTTSVMHLVSLADFPTPDTAGNVKFISLYNWKFSCVEEKPAFKDILNDFDARAFRLYDPNALTIENDYYLKGYVPLPHFLRKGMKTLSWYRSPMLPYPGGYPSALTNDMNISADDYLQFDSAGSNMLHVSFAAAWQLGRMLTLQNQDVALAIQKMKREIAQPIKSIDLNPKEHLDFLKGNSLSERQQQIIDCVKYMATDPENPCSDPDNPCSDPENPCSGITFDPIIAKWLGKLMTLEVVPFDYLVPNEMMLPPESLRFFTLDFNWVKALMEGALSVGGNERFSLDMPDFANDTIVSGFLLRSEVVGDYPDMHVAGYSQTPETAIIDDHHEYSDEDDPTKDEKLKAMTFHPTIKRQLSSEVLLCMFVGKIETGSNGTSSLQPMTDPIKTLDLFLKKEALHMGFEIVASTSVPIVHSLSKTVRDPGTDPSDPDLGNQVGSPFSVENCIDNNRILDISALNTMLDQEIEKITIDNNGGTTKKYQNFNIDSSHQFTLQMMEGVPKVRFIVDWTPPSE